MQQVVLLVLLGLVCLALSKPLEEDITSAEQGDGKVLSIKKRFINPMFTLGGFSDGGVTKMRTKRSEDDDECEKLTLCRLHARSRHSFLATFQLYFVNKENARQWDHHARSLADCERRYGDCYRK